MPTLPFAIVFLLGILIYAFRILRNAHARVDLVNRLRFHSTQTNICFKLRSIPTVGPSGVLSSYIGAFKYIFNARDSLQEGYDKVGNNAYYHSTLTWCPVSSESRCFQDRRSRPLGCCCLQTRLDHGREVGSWKLVVFSWRRLRRSFIRCHLYPVLTFISDPWRPLYTGLIGIQRPISLQHHSRTFNPECQ